MDELTLLRKLADAAFTVRDRQKTYFHTRNRNLIPMAKEAEKQLDAYIAEYREKRHQPDMFAGLTEPDQPP